MENKKNNDDKGISLVLVGILTIVVAIAGSTYAFFSVSNTANGISGSSAYNSSALTVLVSQKTPTSSTANNAKKLVPQLGTYINTAVNTTYNCLDGNGNLVCKVYEVKVTNATTTPFYITGTMVLTATSMPNLKWSKSTAVASGFNTTGYTSATTNVLDPTKGSAESTTLLAANGSVTFYLVFWINEINDAQTDSGTFTASITVKGYSTSDVGDDAVQGVTSTIRS